MKKKIIIIFIVLSLVSVVYAATRNVVPRADGEGGLGTSAKNWLSAYIDSMFTDSVTFTDATTAPDATGELLYDNDLAGVDDGWFCWYDDDEVKYLVDTDTLPTDAEDDYHLAYDKDTDTLYWKADADSGGATAWDDITDPDAADVIDFGAHITQLDVNDFRIGDVGAGYMKIAKHAVSFVGTGDIDLPADSVDDADINWGDIANLAAGGACTLSATVTVNDDEATDDDHEIVFTTDNATLESDGDFHYSPDTGTVTATEFVGGGVGLTGLDGENIANDTIDNDSIDWGDMTDLGTDGVVVWGNITEGELADSTVVSADIKDDTIDSADYAAGSIDDEHIADDTIQEPALNITNAAEEGIDNYVLTYNHAGTNFTWAEDQTGGNTAWDDISDPDAADTIDFGAHITQLDVNDFRVGDVGAGYMKIAKHVVSFVGTGDIDLPDDSVDDADINWGGLTDLAAGGAVTWTNLTEGELTDQVIVTDDIKEGTILVGDMAANSIDSDQYVDGSIDQEHFAADIIGADEYADGDLGDTSFSGGASTVESMTLGDASTGTYYVGLFADDTGTGRPIYADAPLSYVQATGTLVATEFSGGGASLTSIDAATGDSATDFFDVGEIADARISDTLTSSTCTGNAATATALATARAIGGVNFDGTAAITPTTIVVADTTDATSFVALWESATGSLLPKSDAGITYAADTGTLGVTILKTANNVKDEPKHMIFNIINPLATQTEDNEICLWPQTPAALTVTNIEITLDAAANEVLGDIKWADAFIGLANAAVINDFDTTSGVRSDSSITAGSVAASKCMYISFDSAPNTAIRQMCVDITFDYD